MTAERRVHRRLLATRFTPPGVRAPLLPRHRWRPYPQAPDRGSSLGWYLAAKGRYNAESHNHNDVGSFIVAVGGQPLLIDVGVETYTKNTFSAARYDIWTMQSEYHNLPVVDGQGQAAVQQCRDGVHLHDGDRQGTQPGGPGRVAAAQDAGSYSGVRPHTRRAGILRKRGDTDGAGHTYCWRSTKLRSTAFMRPCQPRPCLRK